MNVATSSDVVGELLDVEALAVGLAAAAKIERVDREPVGDQLLGDPDVVAAVRVEAVRDEHDGAAAGGLRRHARVKILSPPSPSNEPSVMTFSCVCPGAEGNHSVRG